jgi:hypothetical protein
MLQQVHEVSNTNVDFGHEEDCYGYPSFGMVGAYLLQLATREAQESPITTYDGLSPLLPSDSCQLNTSGVTSPNKPESKAQAWTFTELSWGNVFSSDSTSSDLAALWSENEVQVTVQPESLQVLLPEDTCRSGSLSYESENKASRHIDWIEVFSSSSSSSGHCASEVQLPSKSELDCASDLEGTLEHASNTEETTPTIGGHHLDAVSLDTGSSDTNSESELDSESTSECDEFSNNLPDNLQNEFIEHVYINALPLHIDSHREYYALVRGYEQKFEMIVEEDEDGVEIGLTAAVSSKSMGSDQFEYGQVNRVHQLESRTKLTFSYPHSLVLLVHRAELQLHRKRRRKRFPLGPRGI